MSNAPIVDIDTLRDQVRDKYRAVAIAPDATYHFHTGRPLAARLGYDTAIVDVGSGAGFDTFIAAHHVGPDGFVVGVDMTDEMLTKSRTTTELLGHAHVEFRRGLVDTFGGAAGETNARTFEVYGYAFLARKPVNPTRAGAAPRNRQRPE